MTGREALNRAALRLGGADPEEARRTAALLLKHATGTDGASFIFSLDKPLPEQALSAFDGFVVRAEAGEPAQYILGRWDFYGRPFKTDRRALIPRPETERLAEETLKAIPPNADIRVIDAGCGTGCIGITIKLERPHARVSLIDVSAGALALAAENAAERGADVTVVQADMRIALPGGPYDVIVSNPPYVDEAGMRALPGSVRDYEPELALFGGVDGLDFVRALVGRAADSLKPGGRLFAEIGFGQAERALSILRAADLRAETISDYAGIPRVVAARKGT